VNFEKLATIRLVTLEINISEIPSSGRDSDGLDGTGSIPGSARLFSSPPRPDRPTQPLIQWVVPGVLYPGVKRPVREADHSPPSGAQAKDGGAIPPLPHMSSWHSA
jgi:hypothetical protein